METMQSLLSKNAQYDRKWGMDESDLVKANDLIRVIESTRTKDHPVPGDIIICQGPNKEYKGHLDKDYTTEYSSICTRAYVPFTGKYIRNRKEIVKFSTSGGYWMAETELEMYKFEKEGEDKLFCAWGSNGPCANGAVHFTAKVNVWRLFREDIY